MGHKSKDTYYVESVIPYQIAERTPDSASVPKAKQKRIRRVFKNYMRYRIIGEFHTHPDGSIKLSGHDKRVIKSSGYELEIVVAINKEGLSQPWDYRDGVLSGSIDKYDIEIACWRVRSRRAIKLTLRCPFATGFDFLKPF